MLTSLHLLLSRARSAIRSHSPCLVRSRLACWLVAAAGCGWAGPLQAQWTTQPIVLRPGWNAVFLELQPEPQVCDALLAGLPIESVWRWNRRFASAQFIQDTNQPIADPKDWLTWINPQIMPASSSSLFQMEGGAGYLIKVATNAPAFTWDLRGRPANRKSAWLSDSFNFIGFSLPAGATPTFQSFFASAPELASGPVYRLNAAGGWQSVLNPASTPMQRGEAFCMRLTGGSDFYGPIDVEMDRRAGLEFGRVLAEQT